MLGRDLKPKSQILAKRGNSTSVFTACPDHYWENQVRFHPYGVIVEE